MFYYQFPVLLIFLSIITNINSSISLKSQESTSIQLKLPHLADQVDSIRPSLELSNNVTRKRIRPKINPNTDLSKVCEGPYKKTNGTTCGLRNIMIGRCYEYIFIKRAYYLTNQTNIKNCIQLYELFESAVRFKPHCNINMSTYESYFNMALAGVHVINRAMFWSGTYGIAHAYAAHGINYITLEDTLAVTMVNGLTWCGKAGTEGFDFETCPYVCKDNKWADFAFWGLASQRFAQLAAGEAYVVLNGSQLNGRVAFRNTSYFAQFELPNLRQNGIYRVTKVNVLLLHSPDHTVSERCGEKSLIDLEELVRNKGFDYACKDDPDELILIMCGVQWHARECEIARRVLRQSWDTKLYGISDSNRISLSLIIFFCVFLFKIMF